jgi:hypothetical protein
MIAGAGKWSPIKKVAKPEKQRTSSPQGVVAVTPWDRV